jgi:putative ABC transport system permease protein
MPAEQRLSGQSGVVTEASATVDSVDNLDSTTTAIKNSLGSSADVTNQQAQIKDTVDSLKNIKNISLYSLIGAVIAGAVIIFLTMLMIVRERRIEIGVTKAIGASNLRIMWQFMVEAVTLTILAAAVGIIIGIVAADPITKTLVNNSTSNSTSQTANGPSLSGGPVTRGFGTGGAGNSVSGGPGAGFVSRGRGLGVIKSNITNIHAATGWSILLYGLAAALAIALVGSAIASWSIAKVRPAEVMRAE